MTVSVTLLSYPAVTPFTASFILTVYDKCATATVDNLGQSLSVLTYVVIQATGPTTLEFQPYSDSVGQEYANPSICGSKSYTILEGYPFVSISPPASGLVFNDPWLISIQTSSLLDVGLYTATV